MFRVSFEDSVWPVKQNISIAMTVTVTLQRLLRVWQDKCDLTIMDWTFGWTLNFQRSFFYGD